MTAMLEPARNSFGCCVGCSLVRGLEESFSTVVV
jgi:hypothetical protein